MKNSAKKVMVLGIDCPIVPRMHRWAMEGKLPTIRKLLEEGAYALNCLVPYPTITPPNWTTISTGAWPGTHGITDFWIHHSGDPLDLTQNAFDSRDCLAERVWTAGERMGKKAIVVNYPSSWPPSLKDGYQIAGYGLAPNDVRVGCPVGTGHTASGNLALDILMSVEPYPLATELVLKKAQGWEGVNHSSKALEATIEPSIRYPVDKLEPIVWHLLVDSRNGDGFDTVILASSKRVDGILTQLRVGEWSRNIYSVFQTEKGPRKGVFRAKLIELSPDASQLRLYVPGLLSLEGWGYPTSIEEEIVSEEGMPFTRPPFIAFNLDWVDGDTLVEAANLHHNWLADASLHLLKNKPWDMFFIHIHTPDWIYHTFAVDLDPSTAKRPEDIPKYRDIELRLYQGVDRLLGQLLEAADDETVVVVTSDHGAKVSRPFVNVDRILERAGLLVHVPAGKGTPKKVDWYSDTTWSTIDEEPEGDIAIDWAHTRAMGQRSAYVYVNLKGRDPQGIVEPGEEYEKVCDQIIKALYDYTDPKTDRKPVVLALRREDARILGLYGDRVGDVIYALDPDYREEHGPFLPTARYGEDWDLRGLFIMKGPNVKKGATIERTVWLTDIVPTICHLADLPVPEHCEGGIVYQALEDPNAKLKELEMVRKSLERYKKFVERPPMC